MSPPKATAWRAQLRGLRIASPAAFGLAYVLLAGLNAFCWRAPSGFAIWLPDAAAAAVLARSRKARWPALLSCLVAAAVTLQVINGTSLLLAGASAAAHIAGAACSAGLIRWNIGHESRRTLSAGRLLASIAIAGIASPTPVVVVMGLLSGPPAGDAASSFWCWWAASLTGSAIVVPPILTGSRAAVRNSLTPRFLLEIGGFIAFSLAVVLVQNAASAVPFSSILVPLLLAAGHLSPAATAFVTATTLTTAHVIQHLTAPSDVAVPFDTPGRLQIAIAVSALLPIGLSLRFKDLRCQQKHLTAREHRFQRIFEDSAIGKAVASLDGRILMVNRALAHMLGYAEPELVGRSLAFFTHPDDVALDAGTMTAALEGRLASYQLEKRYVRKNGRNIWVLVSGSILKDPAAEAPQFLLCQFQDIDARKRAEVALQEAESRWQFALQSGSQGVWDADLVTGRTFYSPVWTGILGYGAAETGEAGDFWYRLVHPDDLDRTRRAEAEHLAGSTPHYECEFRMRHKLGHWLWILNRGKVVERDSSGRALRTIGTFTDISARKTAEMIQRETAEHYRFLAEFGADMIIRLHDGRRVYVSPASRTLLGYDPEEMLRMNAETAIHPEDLARLRPKWAAAVSACEAMTCAYRMRRKDGRWLWVEAVSRTAAMEGASGVETIILVRDISERVAFNQKLEESEASYRLIAERSGDVTFKLDHRLRCTYVSPSCRDVLGFVPSELVGHAFGERTHPDDVAAALGVYQDLLAGQQRIMLVIRLLHKSRGYIWAEISLQRFEAAPATEPAGILGALRDITHRKALEAELRLAKIKAEDASTAKAEFLANMTHELRTPVAGIIAAADLLLADPAATMSPSQRDVLEMQRDAGKGLLTIVNDILDLSKIEAGQLVIEHIVVPLRQLAEGAIATMRQQAQAKAITIDLRIQANAPPSIEGDEIRIRQILLNLLSNAVKFTPDGGEIWLDIDTPSDDLLRFSVVDTGIGIEACMIERIFERFTQADSSTARRYGGSGLGLAISGKLAALMNGRIDVQSEVGRGSTFSLTIPMAIPGAVAKPVQSGSMKKLSRPFRVLLAEDNITNQRLITMMLQHAGCRVDAVTDGTEAIKLSLGPGADFDLVLMDLQMPGLDGYQATQLIRLGLCGRHLPIVALSANAALSAVDKALAGGMDAYITKPIDWPRLFSIIEGIAPSIAWPALPKRGSRRARSGPADAALAMERIDLDRLRETLGSDNTSRLLHLFRDELCHGFTDPPNARRFAEEVHRLSSSAAFLGFEHVASACRTLLRILKTQEVDVQILAMVLHLVVTQAVNTIDELPTEDRLCGATRWAPALSPPDVVERDPSV